MSTTTQSDDDEPQGTLVQQWASRALDDSSGLYQALFYVAAAFFLITTLFPFYWLLVLTLTPNSKISNMGLLPKGLNVHAFVQVFQVVPIQIYIVNSLVLAIMTTVIVLVIASLAGYVFGRLEFPGKTPLMIAILAVSYFPPAAFLLPLFRLFTGNVVLFGVHSPNVYNTPWAMVTPFSALFLPLSIFILSTFYGQIPDGLEDAARIEGTTRLGALFRVIIPLSAPGVATAGVLTFISVYNEFFFSYLMSDGGIPNNLGGILSGQNHWAPVVQGILNYQSYHLTLYNLMAGASIIAVLPVAILVVIAQEQIVSGLTQGALKE